jgi:farnesyl diphosphate synthase
MNVEFEKKLKQGTQIIEKRLNELLTPGEHFGPPKQLAEAMRYAVLNGGKRFRPYLLIETARLFGISPVAVQDVACGLEFLHGYSLIHDDLPAMDDDDMRRGKPSIHRQYDEATAILAGDALQSLAFEVTAAPEAGLAADVRIKLVHELAIASGWAGMAGGQMLDLATEAVFTSPRLAIIQRIHSLKTGALMEYACVAGAVIGGADENQQQALREYGQLVGLAFQASDDLLDATGNAEKLGKATDKDARANKATIVARMGIEKSGEYIEKLKNGAIQALAPFKDNADTLVEVANFVASREN